jgi:hypothetical protein
MRPATDHHCQRHDTRSRDWTSCGHGGCAPMLQEMRAKRRGASGLGAEALDWMKRWVPGRGGKLAPRTVDAVKAAKTEAHHGEDWHRRAQGSNPGLRVGRGRRAQGISAIALCSCSASGAPFAPANSWHCGWKTLESEQLIVHVRRSKEDQFGSGVVVALAASPGARPDLGREPPTTSATITSSRWSNSGAD